ncbi:hypothetical protein LSH36_79g11009 [Paralvinella palmiformis]|uniref:C2H2-type domain-containing protein n=1 Tax=Paralvinella palmiformis TaxID=53620 RepID=A0AAD9K250_9ANNE|nr:hypothetical protein LSH36_79g11009 [Paralvinella palmiformis]
MTECHILLQIRCEMCGKMFYRSYILRHQRAVHFKFRFPCNMCDKTYTLPENLARHKKVVHTDEKHGASLTAGSNSNTMHSFDLFQCDVCGKTFLTPSRLKRHKDGIHLKLRYKCNMCTRSYTQQDNLLTHQKLAHCMRQ